MSNNKRSEAHMKKLRVAVENLDNVVNEIKSELLLKKSDAVLNEMSKLVSRAKVLTKVGNSHGGNIRAKRLSPERRSNISRMAASKRWHKINNNMGGS